MILVLFQVLYGVNEKLANEDVDSPLCAVRPVKKVLLTCVTGDRGLCGGYNSFVIRKVTTHILPTPPPPPPLGFSMMRLLPRLPLVC